MYINILYFFAAILSVAFGVQGVEPNNDVSFVNTNGAARLVFVYLFAYSMRISILECMVNLNKFFVVEAFCKILSN